MLSGTTGPHRGADRARARKALAAGALAGLTVFLATCLSGAALYRRSAAALRDEVRGNLRGNAVMFSALVDGDAHRRFTSPGQESGSEYARAIGPLARVLAARKDIKFVYTCILVNEKVFFVLDPTATGDADGDGVDDKSHIMQFYPDAGPMMIRSLRSGTPQADTEPYADAWGTFMSGYAPFFDREGRQVGVVGVDMAAEEYVSRLGKMRSAAFYGLSVALFLSLAVSVTVHRLTRKLVRAHGELRTRVQELAVANAALAESNGVLQQEVAERERAVTLLRSSEEQLAHQAFHDALTGLPNRALFMDRLARALERSRREQEPRPLAVLFLDLDNFKVVNDSLGHEQGDRLLNEIAVRLSGCTRPGDTLARLGGDEFTILLEGLPSVDDVARVVGRITALLAEPVRLAAREVFTTASIGAAVYASGHDATPDDLVRDADIAMYQAKTGGKAGFALFDPAMNTRAGERLELETDLRRALENGEFRVYYQPIMRLDSGKLSGVEALVRWEHPRLGLIPPAKFIPLAEETGQIVPIGRWALEEACRQMQSWNGRDPQEPPLAVSVNVSARQLQQPDLTQTVSAVLHTTGLHPSCLNLEITESVMMVDAEATAEKLHGLRSLGVRLAVDDFGTGYSSMAYLSRFPIDTLKIDRSFTMRLGQQHGDDGVAIVRAIITLARSLNLGVVSEGIETAEQFALLQNMGSDEGQGYYFARPLTSAATAELIRTSRQRPAALRTAAQSRDGNALALRLVA